VKEQIQVAAGEKLSMRQEDIEWRGHAIECRLNAEDHEHGFRPSPGAVTYWYKPGGPGLRVDSHVYAGYTVPPYYDSMIGKLIAYGKTREEATRRMEIALDEMIVEGVKTTIPFHRLALRHPRFQAGDLDTRFVEGLLAPKPADPPAPAPAADVEPVAVAATSGDTAAAADPPKRKRRR
jgi:acetyl-CoA carboxylase biotin carboxylase subunit